MYPLNKIIAARMTDHGISKREIARALFPKKQSKGVAIISDFLYNDRYNPELAEQLLKFVPVEPYIVEAFTQAGEQIKYLHDRLDSEREKQKELNARRRRMKNFSPVLLRIAGEIPGENERARKLVLGKYPLEVEEFDARHFLDLSKEEQFARVKELILEDFATFGSRKHVPYEIVGYVFRRGLYERYEYNTLGEITNDDNRFD